MLQNGVDTYTQLGSNGGEKAFKQYQSYLNSDTSKSGAIANNYAQFHDDMDKFFFADVDLFVREKVGMVIGYPSMITQIEQANKRAGSDHTFSLKLLRSAPIPQIKADDSKDAVNLADYQYFVLSKNSQSPDLGYQFLAYLAEK